jgi:hypothetical protein
MVLGGTLAEWATLAALVLGPGLVATLLWSPVLVAGRLRAFFRALPLTRSMILNYVIVAMALSAPWIIGLVLGLAELGADTNGVQAYGTPVLRAAGRLSILYLVGLPVGAGAVIPALGVDWDPHDYQATTWVLLAAAGAWYAAIFAVPSALFGLIVSMPT